MRLRRSVLVLLSAVSMMLAACTTSDGTPTGAGGSSTAADKPTTPVVVILDGSESMQIADAPGPRIDAARNAVSTFISDLTPGTPFGLVAYGNTESAKTTPQAVGCEDVSTLIRLGPIDKEAARSAIDGVRAQGWTPLSAALTRAAEMLGTEAGSVVLVSDGEANCLPDPCATARSLREQNPNLTISTVGFKSDAAQLQCVAREGGGVFITADNAAQLSARIDAARDAEAASSKLTNTGLAGVELGQTHSQITGAHPAFPGLTTGTSEGDRTVVRWRECDWVFQNGTLVEIRPLGSTSATVDGITVGTPMTRVVELFGQPVRDDTASSTAYFAADKARGTALRIGYQGSVADGTVRSIVLCRCLPDESSGAPTGNSGVATKTELCAANKNVADIFTGPVNIINDVGGTQYLALVENLGRVAQRYPNEAVQYEGGQLVELAQGGVVTLDQYYSKQNIRAACRG